MQATGLRQRVEIDYQNEKPFIPFDGEDIYGTLFFFKKILELSKKDTWLPGKIYAHEIERIQSAIEKIELEKMYSEDTKTYRKEKEPLAEQVRMQDPMSISREVEDIVDEIFESRRGYPDPKGTQENLSFYDIKKHRDRIIRTPRSMQTRPRPKCESSEKGKIKEDVSQCDSVEGMEYFGKKTLEQIRLITKNHTFLQELHSAFLSILPNLPKIPDFHIEKFYSHQNEVPADYTNSFGVEVTFCKKKYGYFSFQQIPNKEPEESIGIFWKGILDSEATTIVSLSNPIEGGKWKFPAFWTNHYCNDLVIGNDWVITCEFEQQLDQEEFEVRLSDGRFDFPALTKRIMKASNLSSGEEREITQFHYQHWNENMKAPSLSLLCHLIELVYVEQENCTHSLIIQAEEPSGDIYSRANEFVFVDALINDLMQQHKSGIDPMECSVDILECMLKMRLPVAFNVFKQVFEAIADLELK